MRMVDMKCFDRLKCINRRMRDLINLFLFEGDLLRPNFGRPVDPEAVRQGGASVLKFEKPPELSSLDAFTRGYFLAALTTYDTSNEDEAFYEGLAVEAINEMIADCERFQRENHETLGDYYDFGLDEEQAGVDFWLTRCGHGAGYWDRGAEEAGDKLTAAAKAFGNCDLYRGDNGKIYAFSG